jgi:oligosaccharide repeat unit polymerase
MLNQLLLAGTVGLLTFTIGLAVGGLPAEPIQQDQITVERSVPEITYNRFGLLLIIGALWCLQAYLMSRSTGSLVDSIVAASQRSFVSDSSGLISALTFCIAPLAILFWAQARYLRGWLWKALSYVLLGALLPWATIINGRATGVVLLWAVALAMRLNTGRGPRPRNTLVILSGSLAVITLGLAWRTASQQSLPISSALSLNFSGIVASMSDALPLLDHLRVGTAYAEFAGPDWGRSFVDGFTVLVPRSLWSEKPIYLPETLGVVVGQSALSGLPAGLLGEGYLAFGWPGLVLYPLVTGFVTAKVHMWGDRHTARNSAMGAWLAFFSLSVAMAAVRTGAQGGLIAAQVAAITIPIYILGLALVRSRQNRRGDVLEERFGRPPAGVEVRTNVARLP